MPLSAELMRGYEPVTGLTFKPPRKDILSSLSPLFIEQALLPSAVDFSNRQD